MTKLLAYFGKGLLGFVGMVIALVVVVSLFSTPAKGAKAGYSVLHFTLVSTGIVASYGDNLGPDLRTGIDLGNAATGDKKKAPAKS